MPLKRHCLPTLKLAGEPLKWCVYEQELPEFLEAAGYHLETPKDRYDLRSRYLLPVGIAEPVGETERFAVAASVQIAA